MKYWFVHIILVGLLIAIWVPTLAQPEYPEQAYEKQTERIPSLPSPEYKPEDIESAVPAAEEPSIISILYSKIEGILSFIILIGNTITFYWQWQDRRVKPTNT